MGDNDSHPVMQFQMPEAFIVSFNVALGAVFLIGLAGNLLVLLAALTQRTAHKTVNAYLANLAVADILHLLSAPSLIHLSIANTWHWGGLMCKAYIMLHFINWTASIFIIVAMSFDRYAAVAATDSWVGRCRSRGFARKLLASQWLASVLVMSPMLLSTRVSESLLPGPDNDSEPIVLLSCTYEAPSPDDVDESNPVWSALAKFVGNARLFGEYTFAIGCVLPGLLLIVFYSLILSRLRPGRAAWSPHRRLAERRFERVTRLVAAVVLFYALCSAPHWIHLHLAMYMRVRLRRSFELLAMASHISSLLGYANSAGNPVLYAYFNEPFRASLRRLLYGNRRSPLRSRRERRSPGGGGAAKAFEEIFDDGDRAGDMAGEQLLRLNGRRCHSDVPAGAVIHGDGGDEAGGRANNAATSVTTFTVVKSATAMSSPMLTGEQLVVSEN